MTQVLTLKGSNPASNADGFIDEDNPSEADVLTFQSKRTSD